MPGVGENIFNTLGKYSAKETEPTWLLLLLLLINGKQKTRMSNKLAKIFEKSNLTTLRKIIQKVLEHYLNSNRD